MSIELRRVRSASDTTAAVVRNSRHRPPAEIASRLPGPSNGNWRGGKTFHKAGYGTHRAPGHPRARKASLYVFEHILVVEETLGRFVMADESVHHLNGVKDDNRPENLELLVRP